MREALSEMSLIDITKVTHSAAATELCSLFLCILAYLALHFCFKQAHFL